MRVLFLTNNRESYVGGNYYQDWILAFKNHHEVTLWGPGYAQPPREAICNADLVVFGHGAIDILLMERKWHKSRRSLFPWRNRLPWYNVDFAKLGCPRILLSKNDYKLIDEKIALAKHQAIDLFITHSRSAAPVFSASGCPVEWIPFGYNSDMFRTKGLTRDIDIGFRGCLHLQHTKSLRGDAIEIVKNACADRRLDLVASDNVENFLVGDAYVDWINRCHLNLNTISAIGTVGPRFYECLACGTIPLAPEDEYEGILKPDEHYVALRPDLSDLREKVALYFNDDRYRSRLQAAGRLLAQKAEKEERYQALWRMLEARGIVPKTEEGI